jgi:hypothetical protein
MADVIVEFAKALMLVRWTGLECIRAPPLVLLCHTRTLPCFSNDRGVAWSERSLGASKQTKCE